jgi:hypothetical protein
MCKHCPASQGCLIKKEECSGCHSAYSDFQSGMKKRYAIIIWGIKPSFKNICHVLKGSRRLPAWGGHADQGGGMTPKYQ